MYISTDLVSDFEKHIFHSENYRDILNTQHEYYSYSKILDSFIYGRKEYYSIAYDDVLNTLFSTDISMKIRYFLDGLIEKIKNNNISYKKKFSSRLIYALENTKYSEKDEKSFNNFKIHIQQINSDILANKLSVVNIKDKYFLNLLYIYRDFIFNDFCIVESFKLMYMVNLEGFIAENSVKNYYNQLEYNVTDVELQQDYKGVDLILEKNGIVENIQVKKITDYKYNGNTKIYIQRSSNDLKKILFSSDINIINFVTTDKILEINYNDIERIDGFKGSDTSQANHFTIVLKEKSAFIEHDWKTDFKDKKSGTIYDLIFNPPPRPDEK